jgi:hypothetical protein
MAEIVRNQMTDSGIELNNVSVAEILDSMPWSIFPNASLLNHAPGQMNFRFRPHGEDPNFCLFEIMALKAVPEDQPLTRDIGMTMAKPGEILKDYAEKIGVAGALLDQDIDNAVAEQKGLNSGIEQIVLARRLESVIAWFQHNLAQWIDSILPLQADGARDYYTLESSLDQGLKCGGVINRPLAE